jgi:hypothetical protein
MISKIDKRRLSDGERAMSLEEPKNVNERREQLAQLHGAICALQSLDDLGSEEANDKAWEDMTILQKRYSKLKKEIEKEGE